MKPSSIKPGQVYGRLTVVSRDTNNPKRQPYWNCLCECGKTATVRADYLKSGHTLSCGCYRESKFISSPENLQTCKNLFEAGKSIEEIAQIMRISPSNVQKFLLESGIEVSLSLVELEGYRGADKLRWARKYIGYGMSLTTIAKAENTTTATVLLALNKLGIPTREPGSQSPEMISRFKAKAQEYWEFYKQGGMSTAEIGKLFGVAPNAIGYILKAHGYAIRSRPEAVRVKRIRFRKETRRIIAARSVKLSETRKASKLSEIEKL